MEHPDGPARTILDLQVGGSTRSELRAALLARGVLLNAHAETLLDDTVFDPRDPEEISIVERSVGDLDLSAGGVESEKNAESATVADERPPHWRRDSRR